MPTLLRPNPELVAVAWLSSHTDLPTGKVATTLPQDIDSWQADGFVTVGPVAGGTAELDTGARRPVVQVDCWANAGQSNKPPWNRAASLAETIIAGCIAFRRPSGVTLPSGYGGAKVLGAHSVSEPRRLPSDVASYARYQLDLEIDWVAT